jgi:hypothetical protein
MVYKKYIKKGDKIYGPYTYESKRVNGIVVSEYHGKHENNKKRLHYTLGVFLIASFLFLAIILENSSLTGNVALQVVTEEVNENSTVLEGKIRLLLSEGELLPADTQIVMELNEDNYTYQMSDFVSESLVDGNFYINGKDINGSGYGYGLAGIRVVYPEVSFQIAISGNGESDEPQNDEGDLDIEENSSESSEVITDESGDDSGEDEIIDENDNSNDSTVDNSIEEDQSENEAGIVGEVINGIAGFISLDVSGYVDGKVTAEKSYKFSISEGQSVSLVEGSVYIDGVQFSDDIINIDIDGNNVVVSTDFLQSESGFGEEYIGEDNYEINMNLADADLPAEEGELVVRLVYSDEEIVSSSSELVGFVDTAPEIVEELNKSINDTIIESVNLYTDEIFSELQLDNEEIELLIEMAGSDNIETIKAEVDNGRLVIKYKLGKYWAEFSYDYENIDSLADLDNQIRFERMQWLKFLVKHLDIEEDEDIVIDSLLGNYSLNENDSNLVDIFETDIESNVSEENNSIFDDNITEENITA